MEDLLNYLNLPIEERELSLLDAISLNYISSTSDPSSLSDLPMYMLRRIMLFDNSFRVLPKITNNTSGISNNNFLSAVLDEDDEDGLVHPMDIFLYLFFKSQNVFRQTLVSHVSKCQLSLPLITCDSSRESVSFNPFAFQALILSRSTDEKNARNFSAVEETLPIISFIRVSDYQYCQKSELLNRILNLKHEYFFHKNCKGNIKRRFLLNGTVEVAWYLAKSKKNALINNHFIMLNLRGNACDYPTQCNFLGKISTLLYVFVPLSQLSRELSEILEQYNNNFESKVIFLIYKGNPITENTTPYITNILSDKNKVIPLKMRNIHNDCEIIALSISNELDKIQKEPPSIMGCIETAKDVGMNCDILQEDLTFIQWIVDGIFKDFPPLKPDENDSCSILATLKKKSLPLQGEFRGWAEANRELQHLKYDIRGEFEVCVSKLREAQAKARKAQMEKLSPPSVLLTDLLKECSRFENNKRGFNLFWNILKNHLDAISRNYLPFLCTEYKNWLRESTSMHPDVDAAERNSRQLTAKTKLRETADSLTDSSIGIEHIFRELGQTFEAYSSSKAKEKASVNHYLPYRPDLLPGIMAHLILSGQAFEIVNGDDNHVPVHWVSEVLLSLSEIIGADKKIFVISVLGIQSSGKSTLLNSMFGISFPVSSGRCTRGVYMQLLPVSECIREQLEYDYLMVLDTEGLRAPELSENLTFKRDNEMATFIVGLGDVAVINIKGESHVEVQDILQITVIAFIRMRETFTKPKCFFVHQNVGDSQADQNLMVARTRLIDTLNETTKCAAEQENQELQYSQFGDVIEFNPEDDVLYFPSLFEGDPPMTSVSSGYIEKAEKLRSKILSCCSNENRSFLTVKEWRTKLINLWNSVLKENFVFSYKNILELNCRVELDAALCTWHSHFAQEMAAQKSKYFNVLYNVESDKLKSTLYEILKKILEDSKNFALELQQSTLEFFFIIHEKKCVFEQWHFQTLRYFANCRDKGNTIVKEECDLIFEVEEKKVNIDVKFGFYQKQIVKIVRDLFEKFGGQISFESSDSVREHFERIWSEWLTQINIPQLHYANISQDLQLCLLENPHLKQLDVFPEKIFLIREIEKYREFGGGEFNDLIVIFGNSQAYPNYFKIIDRQTNTLISGIMTTLRILLVGEKDSIDQRNRKKIQSIIQDLSNKVESIAKDSLPKDSNYSNDFFDVLIDKAVTSISNHNKSEKNNGRESFILTNHFIFDFAFYQCCKAIKHFEFLQEKFIEKNNLEYRLDQLKSNLFEKFSLLCTGIYSENVCAENLATIILDGVKRYLNENVFQILHNLFVNDQEHDTIYSSRASLKLAILKHLASKKSFDDYIHYIDSPFDSISHFIEQNISEYSHKSHVFANLLSKLGIEVDEILKALIDATNSDIFDEVVNWQEWKGIFHSSISNLVRGVQLSDLGILDVYPVHNFHQFSELLTQALKTAFSTFSWKNWLEETLASSTNRACKDIRASITRSLIDCKALCPFCREPCQLSAGEHEHYCGSFHRPQGISGWHYLHSEEICTEECDQNVLLNNKFIYHGVRYNYADYRTVSEYFNSWKILGEDYIESKYWQWVLCTFHKEFADHYNIEQNDEVEIKWHSLSEEEVINDLGKHYQNYTFKNAC